MGGGGSKEGALEHGDPLSLGMVSDPLHSDEEGCCKRYCGKICPCCCATDLVTTVSIVPSLKRFFLVLKVNLIPQLVGSDVYWRSNC